MIALAVMSLIAIDYSQFDTISLSLLQPAAAVGVASSAIALSYIACAWEQRNIEASLYPIAAGGFGIAATVIFSCNLD
jgi:dolichyl-diphosphooligosaccharide--protein glycosyltransferase